jgi:hypothetical protein
VGFVDFVSHFALTVITLCLDLTCMLYRLIKAKELDAFELRALDKFSAEDALKILERFAEADLRKVT